MCEKVFFLIQALNFNIFIEQGLVSYMYHTYDCY